MFCAFIPNRFLTQSDAMFNPKLDKKSSPKVITAKAMLPFFTCEDTSIACCIAQTIDSDIITSDNPIAAFIIACLRFPFQATHNHA